MSRKNSRRRNAARLRRTTPTPSVGSAAVRETAAPAAHATKYFSHIPIGCPGAPVTAWLRLSTKDALRIAVCECGERIEERVRATKPLRGGHDLRRFVGRVLADRANVDAFASTHLACGAATLYGPTECRETFWGIPSVVPARVRFWADELLAQAIEDDTANAPVTVSVSVLTIDTFGREQSYSREVPPHPASDNIDMDLWMRANLLDLAAGCPGRLVGAMLVAREVDVDGAGGDPPAVALVATPQTRFSGLLAFEPRHALGRSTEPRLYDWQPMILPNNVFDGLFA